MPRRALAAAALLALGLAGAASAGLTSGRAAGRTPCPATSSGTSTAITTVGSSGTTTVIPVGGVTSPAPVCEQESTITPTVTSSNASSTLVITGHGFGHGMGMSQWGAYGYAIHGWGYARILRHYYPGTAIARGPSPTVRVLLASGAPDVTLSSVSPWRVVDAHHTTLALPAGTVSLRPSLELDGRTLTAPLTFEPGASPLELGGAAYDGTLVIGVDARELEVVNDVGLEQYLDGVVGAEMPGSWPKAALEAQAIAARSFALSQLATVVTASPYDLYADGRSQVYGGLVDETPAVEQAVAATARLAVYYRGKIATTYYSSSSGGETVSAAEGLGTPVPYLVAVPDPYDVLSPFHDWGPVLVSARSAGKKLGLGGTVLALSTSPARPGHVAEVTATGPKGVRTLSGTEVEGDLDLRSTWFSFGWLTLTPPAGAVRPGAVISLTGSAEGLTGVTLESRVGGGPWQAAGPISTDAAGAFTVRVDPMVTTRYRLAAGAARGGLITVSVT